MKEKKYKLNASDCNQGLLKFYENAAKKTGHKVTDSTLFNCTKICISKPIYNALRTYYAENDLEQSEFTALMLHYGPKATVQSNKYEIVVEKGFAKEPA